MKRWMIAMLAGAALAGSAAALAAGEDASVDKRLADAQRRLEDAAREVAELSGEAAGPGAFRQFEYFLPGARRAMLGVNLGASESNGGGVRVEGVSPGGPAAEAGVKPGDVIVAVQAKPVTTGRELVRAMEAVEPGEKVELGLKRDGKPVKIAVEARPLDRTFFVGTPGVPAVRSAAAAACRARAVRGRGDAHGRRPALVARGLGRRRVRHDDAGARPLFRRRQGRAGGARAGGRIPRAQGRRRHRRDRRPRAAERPPRDADPALVPAGRVRRAQDPARPQDADAFVEDPGARGARRDAAACRAAPSACGAGAGRAAAARERFAQPESSVRCASLRGPCAAPTSLISCPRN